MGLDIWSLHHLHYSRYSCKDQKDVKNHNTTSTLLFRVHCFWGVSRPCLITNLLYCTHQYLCHLYICWCLYLSICWSPSCYMPSYNYILVGIRIAISSSSRLLFLWFNQSLMKWHEEYDGDDNDATTDSRQKIKTEWNSLLYFFSVWDTFYVTYLCIYTVLALLLLFFRIKIQGRLQYQHWTLVTKEKLS